MSGGFAQRDLTDYGAIGNLRTAALVGRDGTVAWCCLPDLDRPSVFAALLDAERGGAFRVAPAGASEGTMHYLPGSNVLETRFDGGVVLTDFFPLQRRGDRLAPGDTAIHRLVEAGDDAAEIEVTWAPRFDYARARTGIGPHEDGYLAAGGGHAAWLQALPEDAQVEIGEGDEGATLRARFTLPAGRACVIVMHDGAAAKPVSLALARRRLRGTLDAWRHWCRLGNDARWAGEQAALVQRSALALKLLCNACTGAIAAAATTSLPEAIGGERNWDYRYAWLRDAGMTVEALLGSGHGHEARAFLEFIERAEDAGPGKGPWLQLVFGMQGESDLAQHELTHLAGYRGSRPVRIGNHIAEHRGHDIYEQILGAALEYLALGKALSPRVMRFLSRTADIAAEEWRKPDHGVWELPDGPRHYVHSKWTCSSALSHAVRLAREFGLKGDAEGWQRESDACREQVLAQGWDAKRGCFRMAYDMDALDAANVLMPVQGFLPADDARVAANLQATLRELTDGDLCYRYRVDDGLRGEEGCFLACSFWLVEALVLAGDVATARARFDRTVARCGPLGLWTEQIDPRSGAHLGNLPQAFSHVAFHDAALRLAKAEGRRVPVDPDPARIAAARSHARRPTATARRRARQGATR